MLALVGITERLSEDADFVSRSPAAWQRAATTRARSSSPATRPHRLRQRAAATCSARCTTTRLPAAGHSSSPTWASATPIPKYIITMRSCTQLPASPAGRQQHAPHHDGLGVSNLASLSGAAWLAGISWLRVRALPCTARVRRRLRKRRNVNRPIEPPPAGGYRTLRAWQPGTVEYQHLQQAYPSLQAFVYGPLPPWRGRLTNAVAASFETHAAAVKMFSGG